MHNIRIKNITSSITGAVTKNNLKIETMTTTTLLFVIALSLLITFNSDIEIYYNKVSKWLFGNQSNICKY